MRLFDLFESTRGTFIGARLTKDSANAIAKWIQDIPNASPIEDLHVTIAFSRNKNISHAPKKFDDLVIDPKTMEFALFGENKDMLVLKFESPDLEKRHKYLRKKYNLPWDFDEYSPHITLVTGVTKDHKLKLPKFKIQLDHEYIEPFG